MAKTNAVKAVEDAYDAMNADEWLAYVARYNITVDGVLAFLAGDAVPKSHVDRGVVSEDDVVLRSSIMERGDVKDVVGDRIPLGSDAQPDPADVEAAAEANRAAGVEGF